MSKDAIINIKSKLSSKNQMTVTTTQKLSFWNTVHQQEAKYGNSNAPKFDWGKDIESNDF